MCIIERFHRIHPDGFREPRQRVRHYQYGTPITPCNDNRVVDVMNQPFDPVLDAPPAPRYEVIEPRPADRRRSPVPKNKSKKIYDDIRLVFDFHIPFTSHKKEKKPNKTKKSPRPEDKMSRPGVPEYSAVPPELRGPPPQMRYPSPKMHPAPQPPPLHHPPVRQPGGQVIPPMTVHSYSSTNSSPSPLPPTRVHQRPRARSLSLTRQYDERNQVIREQERCKRFKRIARAENAARRRAERDAERVREERDRERRRNDDIRAREQQREAEVLERERRRRSEEERERQAVIARRRREDDFRRARAVLERERRAEEERQWRHQEDEDRLERQRMVRIPRAPRHPTAVYYDHPRHRYEHDGFEEAARDNFERRGNQVIREAIAAERRRQAEQDRNGALARRPAEGGPRRRRMIEAGERRVFDDDRRRWGNIGGRWF